LVVQCPGCSIRRKYTGRLPATLRCKKCGTIFPAGESFTPDAVSEKKWRIKGSNGPLVSLRVLRYRLKADTLDGNDEISDDGTSWVKAKDHPLLSQLLENSQQPPLRKPDPPPAKKEDSSLALAAKPLPPEGRTVEHMPGRKKGWLTTFGIASYAVIAAAIFFPLSRGIEDIDRENRNLKVENIRLKENLSALERKFLSIDAEFDNLRKAGDELIRTKNIIEAIKKSIDSNKIYLAISLEEDRLHVKTATRTLKSYPVSTGKGKVVLKTTGEAYNFLTPRGRRIIHMKEKDPVWIRPDWAWAEEGKELPENLSIQDRAVEGVMGKYRLKLGGSYGIHGTKDGMIKGEKETHGCIRMARKDLQELFKMVKEGTEVYIY